MKNKNLLKIILFCSVIILLSGAIVLTVVLVKNAGSDNNEPPLFNPITDGVDSRVYYYSVAGGDVELTLLKSWRFTLIGPDTNKSGSYSLEGSVLTLDFVRDKDGTATATLGSNKLVLLLNGVTMTYRERVNYTVSFNTAGGDEVESISVLNGKTVSEPDAPEKDGYSFGGWYSDAELTKPFNFDSLITSDTVLYAKWQ